MKIGIDMGGHKIIAALVRERGGDLPEIVSTLELATPEGRSVERVFAALADMTGELSRGAEIDGVGLALPSMLDADRRHSRKMPNFPPEWDDLDIVSALEEALIARGMQYRVAIENDANCYALGEGVAGVALGVSDYVVFTMGTGIGSGIILGGRLLIGSHGMAGEIGHGVVHGEAPCGCGGIGHAETLAAADGTSARARERGLPGNFRELWTMRGTDPADEVLDVTIDAMARLVASTCHTLDPEMIIIGGGMSAAPGIVEAIADRAQPYLSRPFKNTLNLKQSKLGSKAALYGAASLPQGGCISSVPSSSPASARA